VSHAVPVQPDLAPPVPPDPPRPSVLRVWLLLALVIVIVLPPLFAGLGLNRVLRVMEDISLVSSQETFLRMHGGTGVPAEPNAWLMPTWNGRPRIVKPPMLVWMNLAAWSDLSPQTSTPDQLLFRARVVAMVMSCLMLAGVFWIGVMLGDEKLGVMAALMAGTNWFVQRQSVTAAYDIHMTAWATLAFAAALAAMRPVQSNGLAPCRTGSLRGYLLWVLAALFLVFAWLVKGLLAMAIVLLPLAAILVYRRAWRKHLPGLATLILLTLMLGVPWFVFAFRVSPHTLDTLVTEYGADRSEFQPPWYYLGLLGLVLPWSVWLAAGLAHPFFEKSRDARVPRLIPWLWFLVLFVMFSIPAAKQQRYILPVIPAAALLGAFVLWDHGRAAGRGTPDRGGLIWMQLHWAGIATASISLPLLLAMQEQWFKRPIAASLSPQMALLLGVAALALALAGWWNHYRGRVFVAAVICAVWMSMVSCVWWERYTAQPREITVLADEAESIAPLIADGKAYYLAFAPDPPALPAESLSRNKEFLFYTRRMFPPLSGEPNLRGVAHVARASGEPLYVIADTNPTHDILMSRAGFEAIRDFRTSMTRTRRLWRLER